MMLTRNGSSRYSQAPVPTKYLFWVVYIFLLELSGSEESFRKSGDNAAPSHSNAVWQSRKNVRHDLTPPSLSHNTFPQIHSPTFKLLVQKGDRILLPCAVRDLGEDHILWRHQANILAGSNISSYSDHSGRIRLFENFTLEISDVSVDDEGEYECFLASPDSSLKLVHTVTVQDPPTLTVLPAKGSVVVIEGETVQIGCIPHGKPKPRITWSKREGPIPWSHLKLFNESVITMERVSRKHTGLYVCAGDNGIGRPALGAVYVRVLHAPEVEVPKRRVHGGLHYKAQLICIVHADPKPEVQWLLGQKPVPLSERILTEARDKMYTLTINLVRESDFGMYICTANNSYGYDLRHIEFSDSTSLNAPALKEFATENATPEESGVWRGNLTHPAHLGRQNESWPKNHLSLSTSSSGASGIRNNYNNITPALPAVLVAFNNLLSWPVVITITVMTALHISNGWHHHPQRKSI